MENNIDQGAINNTTYSPSIPNNSNKYQILFIISIVLLLFVSAISVYLINELNDLKKLNINSNDTAKIISTPIPVSPSIVTTKPLTDSEQIRNLACKRTDCTDQNTSVEIKKVSGVYASGRTSGGVGGFAWWAVKINGTWKIVWETQDAMACQISQKYNIPVEMYAMDGKTNDCYSSYKQEDINKFINGIE